MQHDGIPIVAKKHFLIQVASDETIQTAAVGVSHSELQIVW